MRRGGYRPFRREQGLPSRRSARTTLGGCDSAASGWVLPFAGLVEGALMPSALGTAAVHGPGMGYARAGGGVLHWTATVQFGEEVRHCIRPLAPPIFDPVWIDGRRHMRRRQAGGGRPRTAGVRAVRGRLLVPVPALVRFRTSAERAVLWAIRRGRRPPRDLFSSHGHVLHAPGSISFPLMRLGTVGVPSRSSWGSTASGAS